MLSFELSEFMIQLKEGTINNLGGPRKSATVKLFGVERAAARAFGDERVRVSFEDDDGNVVETALFPPEIESLVGDLDDLRDDGSVTGFGDSP